MRERAVITGLGLVVPGGVGLEPAWERMTSGKSAVRRISRFDPTAFRSQIAAEADFDPRAAGLSAREGRRMDRAAQFAVVCSRWAVEDSGVDLGKVDPSRVAVNLGSAVGCTEGLEQEYEIVSDAGRLWEVDPHQAMPYLYSLMVPSSIAADVARDVAAEGPVSMISTGCTSGIDAVGYAAQLIEDGRADVVVTGATEAPISPITSACFDAIKATSSNNTDPDGASRPFDKNRDGFVLGEGCAAIILEPESRARARGARIYARVAGYQARSNAYHMTGLKPDGREMAQAISEALHMSRHNARDIGYINAHGSSTQQNDRHETAAFKRALKDHAYKVPVSSLKSMIGHSLGAIGSIEVAACALALQRGVVPPTANYTTPDPECDLDYVPGGARDKQLDVVLTVGSGFGGFQSAMVLDRV